MNYREALAWLYATQRFGIKLGLENTERLLVALSLAEGRALRDHSWMSKRDGEAMASQSSALQDDLLSVHDRIGPGEVV